MKALKFFQIALLALVLAFAPMSRLFAAEVLKVLGQTTVTANTDTTLYTVPASTSTVISTITICNQSASSVTFRVAIRPAGAAITTAHYISFDTTIPANDSLVLTLGLTLATTDVITVRSNSTSVSFNAYGSEIS